MKIFAYAVSVLGLSSSMALACSVERVQHIENKDVKVWITQVCPKDELPYHSHQYPRIVISDKDGELDVIYKSGKKSIIVLKKNIPVYLDKKQGLELHKDVNSGTEPLNLIVVELQNAK
ncbi:hypothetical protein [Xenorhabdus innexi]|uniref:Lipoprotein n=1 Tax=Xenorhabdus innexi TaxID=290109 RepID=A0A1N6MUI2_9GAMM|nr:hypothetical protein [Xenorhabdus innexi]PHM30237.1 hypothetical protein Xinn_03423 [Xenorhabdus innexi]SIP72472.1 conserved exported hypothetical protein [Xenorhabdus innexi]